ncbi:hypothetical protein EDD16DRAFT_1521870 [Pisolithus croceorrhizus]|nr:hypothetical protein EDD16DRAFT_1521870 [Pisolithus croceorrhizus]
MRWFQIPATWLHRFNSVCLLVVEASLRLGSLASQQSRDVVGRACMWGHPYLQLLFNFVLGFLPFALSYVEFQQSRTFPLDLDSPPSLGSFPPLNQLAPSILHGYPSYLPSHTLGSPPQHCYPQAAAPPPPGLPQALLSSQAWRKCIGNILGTLHHLLPAADIHPPQVYYAAALQQNFEQDHAER